VQCSIPVTPAASNNKCLAAACERPVVSNTALIDEKSFHMPYFLVFQPRSHVTWAGQLMPYSKWRTAAILKIALSPYLSRELSDFDQIEDMHLTKDGNF